MFQKGPKLCFPDDNQLLMCLSPRVGTPSSLLRSVSSERLLSRGLSSIKTLLLFPENLPRRLAPSGSSKPPARSVSSTTDELTGIVPDLRLFALIIALIVIIFTGPKRGDLGEKVAGDIDISRTSPIEPVNSGSWLLKGLRHGRGNNGTIGYASDAAARPVSWRPCCLPLSRSGESESGLELEEVRRPAGLRPLELRRRTRWPS